MKIGIPRETKNNEDRVGLTPNGVSVLIDEGHKVLVETKAGIGSQLRTMITKRQAQPSLIALLKHGMQSWLLK